MRPPWLKFYPSDWQADHLLGTCSLAARGLWIEMLATMHAADPAGSLARSGAPLTNAQIAILARCSAKEAQRLIAELETAGVFSRDEDGTIFSRRMRRDLVKAERDRENGKGGGNPNLGRRGKHSSPVGVNPPIKGEVIREDKAQIPEARYQKDPSREQGFQDEARVGPADAGPPSAPDPAAWDDDAPFGRDAAAVGAR